MTTSVELNLSEEEFSLELSESHTALRQSIIEFYQKRLSGKSESANNEIENGLINRLNEIDFLEKENTDTHLDVFIAFEQIAYYDSEAAISCLTKLPNLWLPDNKNMRAKNHQALVDKKIVSVAISNGDQGIEQKTALGFFSIEGETVIVLEKNTNENRLLLVDISNKQISAFDKQSELGFHFIKLKKFHYTEVDIVESIELEDAENPILRLITFYSSILLGLVKSNLDASFDYAKSRKSFGKPIINHQAVSLRLANMLTEYEATQIFALSVIADFDMQLDMPLHKGCEIAQLEKQISHMARLINKEAIQIAGAHGYVKGLPVADKFIIGNSLVLFIQHLTKLAKTHC